MNISKQPKVFLFTPPGFVVPAPLIGVPLLKAYLKEQKIECNSADLNIRFLCWLLEEGSVLNEYAIKVIRQFNQFTGKGIPWEQEFQNFNNMLYQLPLIPPGVLKEYLNGEVLVGSPRGTVPGSWKDDAMRMAFILRIGYAGFFQGDPAGPLEKLSTGQKRMAESLKQFLETREIRSILEKAAKADIVGFSVSFLVQQIVPALIIAKEIRRINPGVFIILGGSGFCVLKEHKQRGILSKNDYIDAICRFGGEHTLRELAFTIGGGKEMKKDIKHVPNLLYYDRVGSEFVDTGFQKILNPDDFPTPEFIDEELRYYYRLSGKWFPGIRLPIFISRGCYWGKCAFCAYNELQQPGQASYLHRSAEKTLEDIQKLQARHSGSFFYLCSPALAPKWLRRFSRGIVEKGITAKFWGYSRVGNPRIMDRELFLLLKQAGFDFFSLGIETAVDRVLKKVKKGNTREDILYTLKGMAGAGIRTKFNLIVDLPPTTYEESVENWKFITKNISFIDELRLFEYSLLEGSYMEKNPDQFDIKVVRNEDGSPRYSLQNALVIENPFYDSPKSKEMVRRFYKLSSDIQFYKLTRPTRERISARGFSWERSSLMFNPFSAVKIRLSNRSGKPEEVFYMFLDDMFKLVKIPEPFSDLILLFREAVKKPMEYRELLEAFKKGFRDYGDPVGEQEQGTTWNRILFHFVHEGWIHDVYCDPLFIEGNFETMEEEIESEIGEAVNPGQWNREELPFVFDAAPFACVAQMQMG